MEKAIEFLQRSLSIAQDTGNKQLEAVGHSNLGRVFSSLGDFKKAIEFYQDSLIIAKGNGNKDVYGTVYNNLGSAYQSLDHLRKAINFCQIALKIAKDTGNKCAEGTVYNNLGVVYQSLNNFENAYEFFQRALRIAKETENRYAEGTVYNNLCSINQYIGDFLGAIKSHQLALSAAKETGNKDSQGKTYINLGSVYQSLNDFQKAIKLYWLGLRIAKETGNEYSEQVARSALAHAFWSHGDFVKAEEFFESSIKLVEKMTLLLHGNDEWKISLREKLDCSRCLMKLQIQQGKILKALSTADKGRAQALVDLMKSKYGVRLIVSSPLSHISSTTLVLARDDESVNIWLLRKGQQCQFLQMKTSNDMISLIYAAYKQIGVNKFLWKKIRPLTAEGALKTLYDLIIAPFSHLINRSDELTIVPDSSLFFIPYAALVDHNSTYLSEKLRIRLAPSLSCLRLLAECPEGYHSTSGVLLVGNPWMEIVRIKGCRPFPQLPGAEEEVKMIGQLLNTEPLTGKNAKKTEVLSRLNSVSLVHIAAHGRPETGEIILSPDFDSVSIIPKEKDFLLTMGDVLDAPLRVKLVVLSCRNSGQGKIKVEGVVGIARAFLGGGACSAIASLWAIDDKATL